MAGFKLTPRNNRQLLSHIFHRVRLTLIILATLAACPVEPSAYAQTANGELEGRPAPVARRKCVGGANAGNLCSGNASCPGSTCAARNVFSITVAVHFNATAAQLTTIQNAISNMSGVVFDATDGQAEIGQATIYNNAFGTAADLRIYNTGADPCGNFCADTGNWKTGGSMHVSFNQLSTTVRVGESLAHEFVHLVFDARDEYESRPAGCGNPTTPASCPDAAAIAVGEVACLMNQGGVNSGPAHRELCWGQGNSANLTDISGGNHDATNVTEQSRCRSNRSCWAQVAWSWPNTILPPAAAPDATNGGAVVNPTNFIVVNNTPRIVLVLDESGSMSLETPTRMQRLQVAANDFVNLAENGAELGIVSFSNDAAPANGHAGVTIAALGANRAAWTNAINGLAPNGWTNIGDGLQKARDMINAAGGVTANTAIILMTDGINNRPSPQTTADADLQSKINDLLAAGIPVFVTCTGGDLGLQSQCSEIAAGTNGFYVDSAHSTNLSEAFVDLHEKAMSREPINSTGGNVFRGGNYTAFVETGAHSTTFTLVWENAKSQADMVIIDPAGNPHQTLPMPQGRYARFLNPTAGEWKVTISNRGDVDSSFLARAYVKHQTQQVGIGIRHARVRPGESLYVYAYPRSSGPVSNKERTILGQVLRPDGSTDKIELYDRGRDPAGGGDDEADDGIFTGVYTKTDLKGAYTFLLTAATERWLPSGDSPKRNQSLRIARFMRQPRISAAVGEPGERPKEFEDQPRGQDGPGSWRCCPWWVWALILVLIVLVVWLWRRSVRK